MNLTEAQAEKVLSTWRISRLEDILGPELSPRSWSNNLRKHLCMLCRLVNLEQARILLSNEVTARLANRTRNRGIRRDHLSDEAQIRGHSDVYSQYSPSPAANQAMRRLDRVSETPDYTRPYPPGPSPDLSADASSYHPSTASSPASTSASTSITTAPSSNPRTGPSLQWSSTALQLLARNAAAGSRSDYYEAGPSTFDDGDRRMSLGNTAPGPRTRRGGARAARPPMTDDTEGITVVERHKRKRESMMADLEGDIEKLGYRVDIQRTTVKLRQHEYAQEQRHLEAARAKLESLSSGDAVAAQMEQFQGFLAGLDDLVARYPAVLHAHDDHSANDMGRALASPSQPPEETNMGLQPGMLFDALKRAVRVKMGSAAHQTERLQDTRRVGERELRVAQAAVDETLATLERAREDLSKLEDDLHFLSIEKERLSDRVGS
ncbi:unnamed protein product [Colletotrichum noveboracense]|uniref:Uncharacterized protein n=1 Tax=Colletotrichum noveboracense TaxID=2664923 RepID=A0A9W4WFL0_9PEZI|nr:unnamed protein product [Colletotrichum noveboracense]